MFFLKKMLNLNKLILYVRSRGYSQYQWHTVFVTTVGLTQLDGTHINITQTIR